jgi:hydroxyacylglutathione hydrolase
MERLYLKQIEIGPMENFIYLIGDNHTRECVMVDPAWDVKQVLKIAEADDMKVVAGLATHYHYDHTNGIGDLLTHHGCPVHIHKDDAPYLKGLQNEVKKVDAGDKLKVGEIEITFIHTPGHTPGSQCFLVNNRLVSGDTLFINACGRCDLPGGDAEQMYHSLQKLAKLKDDVILLPGHNYAAENTSTIGKEKQFNPYYQARSVEEFLDSRM